MLLRVQPPGLAGSELDSALTSVGRDHSREVGQRNHHAVWVTVRVRCVARLVAILQDADPIIFKHDTIQLGIGQHWIIHGITVP
jgi:hypothetical protein